MPIRYPDWTPADDTPATAHTQGRTPPAPWSGSAQCQRVTALGCPSERRRAEGPGWAMRRYNDDTVMTRGLRSFLDRDWAAVRDAKDAYWAEVTRLRGPLEALRIPAAPSPPGQAVCPGG